MKKKPRQMWVPEVFKKAVYEEKAKDPERTITAILEGWAKEKKEKKNERMFPKL